MKLSKVVNPEFQKALMKLSNQDLPVMVARDVLSILKKVQETTEEYHKERMKLLTENSEKDSQGNVKTDASGNCIIKEGKRAEVDEALINMANKSVTLSNIEMKDLKEVRLSAQDFSLLEDLVSI